MDWALTVLVPPAEEPVSLAEAKLHLRVDHPDEDARITALIKAAREWCEAFQARAYCTQTLRLHMERWPRPCGRSNGRLIWLPRPPLQAVQAIRYTLADGTQRTLPTSSYAVQTASQPGAVVLVPGADWPSEPLAPGLPVTVDYVAGYGGPTAVPERVKQAMLLLIGHWHENPSAVITGTISRALEFSTEALLWQERVFYAGPEG